MSIFKFFRKRKLTIDTANKKDKALKINETDLQFLKKRPSFTPEHINVLSSNEVFVFGSNIDGHHGGGAARTALNKFDAINGQGVGLQGQSYGIPTMHGGIETIAPYVDEFIDFAIEHPKKFFYVTRIGCGIAGFRDEEIAPLFKRALNLDNVCLPKAFILAQIKQPKSKTKEKSKTNKPVTIKLTKSILDGILPKEIIYAEVAGGGAMGNAGGIMLYLIKNEQLICYETNVFTDEEVYLLANKLLLKYQDIFKYDDIDVVVILFNHFYGGMGNNVFINKNVTLEIKKGYFIHNRDSIEYQILSSVQGVFESVVYAMKHPKNEDLF
jgi:hypothetical protein